MNCPSLRAKMFLQILKKAKYGTVNLSLPDGACDSYGDGEPHIDVKVNDWMAIDLLFTKGDLGLAEVIINERVVVDDIASLVEWACKNEHNLSQAIYGSWYGTLAAKLRYFFTSNDRKNAKKNIMAHYDLGNEFYSLWLDPSMTYSSALFTKPELDLQSAQNAKYDRIIDLLDLKSSDHVLEIGCGWGGFFTRAVERTDCKVTAVMNSPEQNRHNCEKISRNKMSNNICLMQQDYRDIWGKFDKVVSIEMIEAVGEKHWRTFFTKVNASLKSKGAALIQGITLREDLFYSYRKSTDFIQQYVFPGGMLMTSKLIKDIGAEQGMKLGDTFEFGMHYANTLKKWHENFNKSLPEIKAMGFDDKFVRMWSLYLSYCEGAFRAERINVGQFLLLS